MRLISASVIILGSLFGLIIFALVGMHKSHVKWVAYRDVHCHAVAHVDGDVFNTYGIGPKGQMVVGIGVTGDKTGWLCDDGVTYYMEN